MSVALAWTILEIFNWVLLGYFIAINGVYLVTSIFAFRAMLHYTRRLKALDAAQVTAGIEPPITLIAPAFNEEDTCVESIRSFLNLSYPELEVMVVNDGSTDETLTRLRLAYQLVPAVRFPTAMIPTQPVRGIYRSSTIPKLWVIDKENGGKADALNAGINCCRTPLFAAMDADTLLERDALPRIVRPFLEDTRTGAVGGIIRIVNGCTVRDGVVTEVKLPRSWLARFQAIEYMRAFLSGRMGWDAADSTLIISGAFGVFRRQLVVEAGGYRHDTVGEDMELVIRLHRHCRQEKIPLRIGFVPDPVAWTQAPETLATLGRQRDRWQRGLTDSLARHRGMLFNPRYGKIGMLAFPYFYLLEMFGPVIEFCGYFVFVAYALAQIINPFFAVAFIMVAFFLGVSLSLSSVGLGEISFRRYARRRDLLMLFLLAVIENFGYRQLVNFYRIRGMLSALLRHKQWGRQKRTTFAPRTVVPVPSAAIPLPEPAIVAAAATPETVALVQVVCLTATPVDEYQEVARELDRVLTAGEEQGALQALVAADAERRQAQEAVLTQALAHDAARYAMQAEDTARRAVVYGEKVQREEELAEAQAQEQAHDQQPDGNAVREDNVEQEQARAAVPLARIEVPAEPRLPQQVTSPATDEAARAALLVAAQQAELQRQRAEHAMLKQALAEETRQQPAHAHAPAPPAGAIGAATRNGTTLYLIDAQEAEQAALAAELSRVSNAREDTLAVQSRLAAELDRQRAKHAALMQELAADAARRAVQEQQRQEREQREQALAALRAQEQEAQQAAAEALAAELAEAQVREQAERSAAALALANELAALRAREQTEWQETMTAARRQQAELTAVLERLRAEEDGLRQRVTVAQPAEQMALAAELARVGTERKETVVVQTRLTAELERQRAEHTALTLAMAADAEQRAALDEEMARLRGERQELQNRVVVTRAQPAEEERVAQARRREEQVVLAEEQLQELAQREQELAQATARSEALAGELAQREQTLLELREQEQREQAGAALARQERAAILAAQRDELARAALTLSEQHAEQAVLTAEMTRLRQENAVLRKEQTATAQTMLASEMARLRNECAAMQAARGGRMQEQVTGAESAPATDVILPAEPGAEETPCYFNLAGQQYGPATLHELNGLVRAYQASPHDWIWLASREEWVQLQNYAPTAALFVAACQGPAEPVAMAV